MKIEVLADVDSVARHAAEAIAGEARAAVKARGRFTVAISGGRTPWVMLRALSSLDVPWESVHVLQVDERIAPEGHADRNLTHMRESLLAQGRHHPEQIHAMPVESADLETQGRPRAMRRPSSNSPDHRRSSISSISAWVPTDTPRRWFRAIRCSTSRTPTSR